MKTTVAAAAAIAAILLGPAFAQSPERAFAPGHHGAPHAGGTHAAGHGHRAVDRRLMRRAPFDAYAQSPSNAVPQTGPSGGYRWPYVKYDANGNMIGPNPIQPDRW